MFFIILIAHAFLSIHFSEADNLSKQVEIGVKWKNMSTEICANRTLFNTKATVK